ncbi:MAG: hypothetical protein B7Z44_17605 [Caulobacter sp. 12-67-6]|nr:MAG: hypothetical protein B7Z44_17605 [Caulobacter sp. 12-67-6]OYX96457.1 MAG: hypothetical protein B7Y78_03630 [Caulobacter sp. 35-67-4]OZA76082.1 MAG: hypothetical protein B7X77_06365 [Caulobacter sp. 39-67-4]
MTRSSPKGAGSRCGFWRRWRGDFRFCLAGRAIAYSRKRLSSRTSAQREDPGPTPELRASGGPGSALRLSGMTDSLAATPCRVAPLDFSPIPLSNPADLARLCPEGGAACACRLGDPT